MSTAQARPHPEVRDELNELRIGKLTYQTQDDKTKTVSRPKHLVTQDVWDLVRGHLESRGRFFQTPTPYYLDEVEPELIRCGYESASLARLLGKLGLRGLETHTQMVTKEIVGMAALSELMPVHHISYSSPDAIYLYASPTRMIKVEADSISEVSVGTDGVVLIAEDLGDWPSLAELQPYVDSLRPLVGDACTRLLPGLPLTRLLTSRWSRESSLSVEQAHQMFLSRVMFMAIASKYSLWPLVLNTGDQESGKSTPLELELCLLKGRLASVKSMPAGGRDLIASVTNSSIVVYDNIDGARLDDPQNAATSDLICHLSTGSEVDQRLMRSDNEQATYQVRNHAFFTARVNPFSRPDVMRRTIHLEMDPPDGAKVDKDSLKAQVLEQRPQLLAEFVLRTQNILRAHLEHGTKSYAYQSGMAEYEAYTMRCAEYEGTLEATREIWAAYVQLYRRSITDTNPIVFAFRLWLGKPGNAKRQVTATTLFGELQGVFMEVGQPFPYRSPAAIGKHIGNNLPPLRVLGLERVNVRAGYEYLFEPSNDERERCVAIYHDLLAASKQRPQQPGFGRRPSPADTAFDEAFDEIATTDYGTIQ